MILGIDEVGRGPWAGPLVVGAVVLPGGLSIAGLTDSKKLSEKRRNELDIIIRSKALGYGLGWVYPDEIDDIGLSKSLKLATIRAVEAVKASYHEIILDGTVNFLEGTSKGKFVTTLAKADLLIPSVSAASIIAKVARDTYMKDQSKIFPEYGFESHVGYGTEKHRKALAEHGVTVLHRRSFAPIAKLLGDDGKITGARVDSPKSSQVAKTSKSIGNKAEAAASKWLQSKGFSIIERNWMTKRCEVDIIAESSTTRYFVEVKYRSSSLQGGGIDAITPDKLKRMKYGAEVYAARNGSILLQQLAVVSVDANNNIAMLEVE